MAAVLVLADLAALAANAVPKTPVDPGWTPTTTMGLVGNIIMALLGGGGLKIFANHLLAMRKIADARAKQVDDRADGYTERLSERVTELEKALLEERRDCERQLTEMRGEMRARDERHTAELHAMQAQVDGLVRQLIQFQQSSAQALSLSPQMQRAMTSLDHVRGSEE